MATQGPLYPGTAAGEAVAPENAEPWANVNNIKVDDGSTASVTAATFDTNDITNRLKATNFGFTIPAGATIDGITVEIDKSDNNIGSAVDNRVQLLDAAGALVGQSKADTSTNWPNTLTTIAYGGATDKWLASPTPAMVNDPDFGVVLSVKATSNNTDVFVDFIRVTIHYTETGPVETEFSTSCSATASGAGASLFSAIGASTGLGSSSFVGVTLISCVGSSAGAGSSSFLGVSVLPANGSVAGAASSSFVGSLIFASNGVAAGASGSQVVSSATASVEANSAGVASESGVGGAIASTEMLGAGVASSAMVGACFYLAEAVSIGVSTSSFIGESVSPGTIFSVWLVPTNDPNASPLRIKTSGGVMSFKLKT